ncbi:hypothetical protein [Serratia sp. P2ACOL2]|uniref:hypothetical protein n=1 Tax=Serratia sp. P2ACOL2 TaxID=2482769 RepID=UPI0013905AFF
MTLEQYRTRRAAGFISRLKNGLSVQHPLQPDETLMLKRWLDDRKDSPHAGHPGCFCRARAAGYRASKSTD